MPLLRSIILVFVAAALAAPPLAAQTTGATRAKPRRAATPAVIRDTIYALAVDSAQYPEDDAVFLLDDGVVRYEKDGRGKRTFRQVVQVLRADAVEGNAEHSFSHIPGRQKLTINWVRVVRPNGEVVSDGPAQVQDADVPAAMGSPVYDERKVRRLSLSGVAPGTIVDYSYTIEELAPSRPGDWFESWSITTGIPVRRSRFLLDVPQEVTPRFFERNLPNPRQATTAKGRTVYAWLAQDVRTVKREPFAADSNGFYAHLAVAAPGAWADVGRWYAGLAKDRYALSPAAARAIDSLVAGAPTLDDSIRAVHRWIAQDIRYVSISLGIGGYQPRPPAAVLSTGFGDCKDKATLFVAAMERLGVVAHPVLLSSGGGVRRELPTIDQFDHVIAVVERGAKRVYTDLTAELAPYGALPFDQQGEFGLVVRRDGSTEEVMLPADPLEANRVDVRITGAIGTDGLFQGAYEERAGGARQYSLRSSFSSAPDSTARANLTRALATRLFPGASGDSLAVFDGRDLAAAPRVALRVRDGRAVRRQGGMDILPLPLGSMASFAAMADELEARRPRRFPIDAAAVVGEHVWTNELRITLPEGWRARLPDPVSATSAFGSYKASYRQEGRDVVVSREMRGAKGTLPPERVDELIAWLREVGKDDAEFFVLDKK